MKVFGLLALFLLFGAAFTVLNFSSSIDLFFTNGSDTNTLTTASRKLKENGAVGNRKGDASGQVSLDDYRPTDPSPSSKASIRPGPVDHGTPLIPFIPKPSPPPSHPPFGGSA